MTIIRVVDLETTGFTPPEAGVCEIGYIDVVAKSTDLVGRPHDWFVDSASGGDIICNPGHPIPPETSAIHHIVDDDVLSAPKFRDICSGITDDTSVPYLAAHNAKFERQFITDDLAPGRGWICTYKAALRLWPDAPSHSNQTLRYWRRPDGLSRDIANVAHRAYPDAYVTAFLLRDMLNDGATIEQLIQWTEEPALQVKCHIGKWRGTPWREVDDGFLYWVSQRDFDEDILFTVRVEMERREREMIDPPKAEDGQ